MLTLWREGSLEKNFHHQIMVDGVEVRLDVKIIAKSWLKQIR
jgi:hypothetical protein